MRLVGESLPFLVNDNACMPPCALSGVLQIQNKVVKICCSVGLKGAVRRFGLIAELSAVLFSAEGWLFILSLPETISVLRNSNCETIQISRYRNRFRFPEDVGWT